MIRNVPTRWRHSASSKVAPRMTTMAGWSPVDDMVHVRFGSRPPSWPQNEVKVLVDAESSLYSSSIETPGPARPWRENVTRPRSSAGLPRLYPFWIIPSDLFPFPLSTNPLSLSVRVPQGCCREPRAALHSLGRPVRWLGALVVLDRVGLASCSTWHWSMPLDTAL